MREYKRCILQFRDDLTGNCQVFLYVNEEDEISDNAINCKISFIVNGEEWAPYYYRRREILTDEIINDAAELSSWIGNCLSFSECLTHHGRKKPPYEKQTKIIQLIEDKSNDQYNDVFEEISAFKDAVLNYVKGTDQDERIASLEQQLAIAKAQAEATSIEGLIMKNVVDALTPSICDKIRERVGALAGAVPTELNVRIKDTVQHLPAEVRHHQFEKILSATIAGEALWLKGDAGTGKSVICKQVAEALGAKYFCTGAIMDEYAGLKGFVDANGIKHGTEFTHALDAAEAGNEVVICFDEADGSVPEVMVAINNYLAGGVIECMGKPYEKLDNLHVMACGNTNGRGGSTLYTRQIIDEATLDRFAFIEVDYDESIELNVAGGNEQLASFCRQLRKSAADCGVQMLVTYRAIKRLAVLSEVWDSKEEALCASVIRGLDKADLETLTRDMDSHGFSNEWLSSLKSLKEKVA